MTLIQYNKAKEKLLSIWFLRPPINQIIKYLKLMYDSLYKQLGFLCKKDILNKISDDTAVLGLSKTKIRQLLLLGKN